MLARAFKLLFLVLFLVLVLGRTSFGQETALRRAESLNLWRDEAWLRLGHYQKHFFFISSPFSGPFFINPAGQNDPRAELLATVRAFTEPSPADLEKYKMPAACFFKARYRWLQSRLDLPPAPPCPERDAWKAQLNATSLTLIFAASDLNSATSSFGHTFLKFSNAKNHGGRELLDYGLNYAADANKNDGIFYALKGLFGFYRGHFSLLPYHQKMREYTNLEGRDLWEYPLRLTSGQVDLLIDHLLELENSSAPYFFASQNCSYELLRALEVADPDFSVSKHLPFFVIPIDAVKHVVRDSDIAQSPQFRQSLKSDYLAHYNLLAQGEQTDLANTVKDLQVPNSREFSSEQRAILLETAMKYYAIQSYQGDHDYDAEEYKLSVQRARLGQVSEPERLPTPPSPDTGHDSSALYFGRGERHGEKFSSLKMRFAFHDLEQNSAGAVKFSRSNILAFEARYAESLRKLSLHRAAWVDVLNTAPLNALEHNLSWKTRFETVDPWMSEVEAGIGYSIDLFDRPNFSARLTGLAAAEYHQTHLRAGPSAILMARLFDRLGLSLESSLYYRNLPAPEIPAHFAADLQLSRNWDIRYESRGTAERQVRLVYNFLL